MDHRKLINSILSKYEGTPSIQRDIRKVLKYVESYNRMFCLDFVKPGTSIDTLDADLDAITATFTGNEEAERSITAVIIAMAKAMTNPEPANVERFQQAMSAIEDPEQHKVAAAAALRVADATAHHMLSTFHQLVEA